jgi:hypothetical protein
MPSRESPQRQTYLLRIWAEPPSSPGERTLRIVLQEVRTGHRAGFGSLDALVEYLSAHIDIDSLGQRIPPVDFPGGFQQ